MARKAELVAVALKALMAAALPGAKVLRNASKPTRPEPGGIVVVSDGDPGEPDVLLSPATYTYQHRFSLNVAAFESATLTREQVLDRLFEAIGQAIDADRYLGGLCEWVEAESPVIDDTQGEGTEPLRWADVTVVCTYTTSGPLA